MIDRSEPRSNLKCRLPLSDSTLASSSPLTGFQRLCPLGTGVVPAPGSGGGAGREVTASARAHPDQPRSRRSAPPALLSPQAPAQAPGLPKEERFLVGPEGQNW